MGIDKMGIDRVGTGQSNGRTWQKVFWAFGVLAVASVLGCSSKQSNDISHLTNTNMKKLYAAMNTFMRLNDFRGPKDQAELVKFFEGNRRAQTILGRCGVKIDELEEILISERDGEPFVVRYGVNGIADHALVFESVGVEGLRMVALSAPVEVDEIKYEEYLSGKVEVARPASAMELAPRRRIEEPK